MKISRLKELIERFDDDAELVVEIPHFRHRLFSKVNTIEEYEEVLDDDGEEISINDKIIVITVGSPGYSPKQVI